MNTEHTTEAWTAYQAPGDICSNLWYIRFSDGLGGSMHGYCGEKRARLIAAAPDLLEALKRIYNLPNNCQCEIDNDVVEAHDQARTAIAKGEGKA